MAYADSLQYSRRDFLRTAAAVSAGSAIVGATGGLTALLAQQATSKTQELAELLERNQNAFDRRARLVYDPDSYKHLPELPQHERYLRQDAIVFQFNLPDFGKVEIEYVPRRSNASIAVYYGDNYLRQTGFSILTEQPRPDFFIHARELDFVKFRGESIPVTIDSMFRKSDLDDTPGKYYTLKTAGDSIPKELRELPASMNNAEATVKYLELTDLALQEARKRVAQAGKK